MPLQWEKIRAGQYVADGPRGYRFRAVRRGSRWALDVGTPEYSGYWQLDGIRYRSLEEARVEATARAAAIVARDPLTVVDLLVRACTGDYVRLCTFDGAFGVAAQAEEHPEVAAGLLGYRTLRGCLGESDVPAHVRHLIIDVYAFPDLLPVLSDAVGEFGRADLVGAVAAVRGAITIMGDIS